MLSLISLDLIDYNNPSLSKFGNSLEDLMKATPVTWTTYL